MTRPGINNFSAGQPTSLTYLKLSFGFPGICSCRGLSEYSPDLRGQGRPTPLVPRGMPGAYQSLQGTIPIDVVPCSGAEIEVVMTGT